jgi:hypothetical protein
MAFDDPARKFPNKPVPTGTMVVYEITAVQVVKEGEVDFFQLVGKWYQVIIFFGIIGGLIVWKIRKSPRKGKSKGKKGR